MGTLIAIVLRDDRGLEQMLRSQSTKAIPLRSFFGTIEDWNTRFMATRAVAGTIAIVLRDDRGLELDG